jgi:hypothetical protein
MVWHARRFHAKDRVIVRAACPPERKATMRTILILLGIVLIVVAAVYLLLPADSLPSFMPGHEAGLARPRMKHGLAAGAVGIVLIAVGWFVGRK